MLYVTGLDFTIDTNLFAHLQNKGDELLLSSGRKLLKSLRFPFVLLVTCDRAEIVSEGSVPHEILERALSLNPIAVSKCRYGIEGQDAEKHIFLLSSGIISPLFGEDTVQGQLREASECARLIGASSPYLDKLFNMAVAFSKRMHTEYRLRVFDSSIIDAVVKQLEKQHRILVVGSGEGARLIASSLLDNHEVHMTLRDITKTFLIPPKAIPVSYEDRMKKALSSDAVISASSGLYHTFTEEEVSLLSDKPMYDLSSPHDLPDADNVIRIADLGVKEPMKESISSIVRSEADSEIASFHSWMDRASSIHDIRLVSEEIALEAMRRLSGVVSALDLNKDKEMNLRSSILDSVRKAYIACSVKKK